MKSRRYKAQRAQCVKVLKSARKDIQVDSFVFEQSRKALQKSHYIQDLLTSLLELLISQQHMTGAVKFIFIAFSIGEWIVRGALTRDNPSESLNIAENTKAFVLKLDSSADFADLKSDFEKKNHKLIETWEEEFRQRVSFVERERGHGPTEYRPNHILQQRRLTMDVAKYGSESESRTISIKSNQSVEAQQLVAVYDLLKIREDSGELSSCMPRPLAI
ncbi:MAG: hypothetical protein Q9157_006887 [Trypethelium eluteriae]